MGTELIHYLLVFDHDKGELIHEQCFEDGPTRGADAVAAYSAMETRYEKHKRIEVVLIGSDSIETIRRTHANYFDGTVTASELLSGI